MTVDELFSTIAKVAGWILPVLGVVIFIYIIRVFSQLLITLKSLTKTLDTTQEQIRKLDAPLSTVEDLSHTVDEVHDTTKQAVKASVDYVAKNFNQVRELLRSKTNTTNKNEIKSTENFEKEDE